MTFGLQVFNSDGSTAFDSNSAVGGVPIAVHTVTSATSYTWPSLAGRTIFVLPLNFTDWQNYTIDYSLGYPRVNYFAGSSNVMLVMAA